MAADQPPNKPPAERQPAPSAPAPIDVQALAEKVYQLMLADLRLERARGAAPKRKER